MVSQGSVSCRLCLKPLRSGSKVKFGNEHVCGAVIWFSILANPWVLIMLLWAVIFFGAALVTVSTTLLIVSRMVRQLVEIVAPERRISSSLLDPRLIIREHNRLFPQSELMLAFWLSIIHLVICLSGMALSLAMDVGTL